MIWKIVLAVIVVAIIGMVYGTFWFANRCRKNGKHEQVLGQVVAWQKAKIPGFSVGVVKYTKKGRVGQTQTCMMRTSKSKKLKGKMMWDMATYTVGTQKMQDAKPAKDGKK